VSLVPGEIIARSYRLIRPIAEGGMGRVWIAEQIALERRVAIKVLTEEIIQSAHCLELFHREARSTARVDHPHVVRVLDFDVMDDGVPFLVLELLVGETLEEHVLRSGPLDGDEALELMRQTCDALGFAHECGILHRDIKAANLFLQQRSRGMDVKLLDFGIALRKSAGRPASIAGTPKYMSPEQLSGAILDERCDLFSLAVAMHYALTGQFPFPGDTAAEVAFAHGGDAPPITKLRPGLPPALDAWFARALAIDPDARFMSASEMLETFEDALTSHEHVAVAVSAPPPARSRTGWAKAGALAAMVTVFVFARFAHTTRAAHAAAPTPSPIVTRAYAAPPAAAAPVITAAVTATAMAPPAPEPIVVVPPSAPVPESHPMPPPAIRRASMRGKPIVIVKDVSPRDAGVDPHDLVIPGTEGFGNRW
jgi:serine/threonine-protein kinase